MEECNVVKFHVPTRSCYYKLPEFSTRNTDEKAGVGPESILE